MKTIKTKKHLGAISLVYFVCHAAVLFLSGIWWDDWCFFGQSPSTLRTWALDMGRPSMIPMMALSESLPSGGYRILVFFLFYFSAIFFYFILINSRFFSDNACLGISLLYITIPVNDARVMLCVIPYSIGIFLFTAAFLLMIRMLETKHGILQIPTLLLFLLSFSLNSNLVFYAVPMLFLTYKAISGKQWRDLFKYAAFFALPVVFYALKSFFFQPSGAYSNYNKTSLESLLYAGKHVIPAVLYLLRNIFQSFFQESLSLFSIRKPLSTDLFLIVLFALFLLQLLFRLVAVWKKTGRNGRVFFLSIFRSSEFRLFLLGFVLMAISIFPYVAVRHSWKLKNTGTLGRDAALFGFGAALFLYFAISVLTKKTKARSLTALVLSIAGILCFQSLYLEYQSDAYRQTALRQGLREQWELKDCTNILCITDDSAEFRRFYTLNANAELVYGDEKRFMVDGTSCLSYLEGNESLFSDETMKKLYHAEAYDPGHKEIDAIIKYGCPLSNTETLSLKWIELLYGRELLETRLEAFSYLTVEDSAELQLAG